MTTTITFCECAENHVGMEKLGRADATGFSLNDLKQFKRSLSAKGIASTIYDLKHDDHTGSAYILVAKDALRLINGDLLAELDALDWDTKALMKGRVVNKHARHNLCFADYDQEPDYNNGKGRVISFSSVPILNELRNILNELTNTHLLAEGNRYYAKSCGIGYHGDAERKRVIGIRLGETMPLTYQWYYKNDRIGDRYYFELEHGDLYIMCEKATGNDWKKRLIPTLRHAAGASQYID